MPVLSDKSAGLFKMTINVGQYFGEADDYFWITLREPTTNEFMGFTTGAAESSQIKEMMKIMPKMIVDHNFEKSEGVLMKETDVWEALSDRALASTEIIEEWSSNIPLAKKIKDKSNESDNSLSQEDE